MPTIEIEIDEAKMRLALARAVEKIALDAESSGHPVAIETDGSRWINLDFLIERLKNDSE